MEIEEKTEQLKVNDIQNCSQKNEYKYPKHIIDYNDKEKKLILKINKIYHVNYICDIQNYLKFGINLKKVKKIKVIFSGEEPVNQVSCYDIYKQGYIEKIRDFIFENEDFQQNLQGIKIDHSQDTYYNSYNMNIASQWFKNVGKRLINLREISFCVSSIQDLSQKNLGVFFGELVQLKKLESLSLKNWEDFLKVDDFKTLVELNQKSLEEFGESLEFVRNLKRFKYKNFKQQDLQEYQNLFFAEKVDVGRGISLFENLEELSLAIDLDMDSGELGFLVGLQKLKKLDVFVNNMQKSRNLFQSEQKDNQNGDDITLVKKVIGYVLQARQVENVCENFQRIKKDQDSQKAQNIVDVNMSGEIGELLKLSKNLKNLSIQFNLNRFIKTNQNILTFFIQEIIQGTKLQKQLENFELSLYNLSFVNGIYVRGQMTQDFLQSKFLTSDKSCYKTILKYCQNNLIEHNFLRNLNLQFFEQNLDFIDQENILMLKKQEKFIKVRKQIIYQLHCLKKMINYRKDIIQEILQFSNMHQLVVKNSMKNLLKQDKNKNCQIFDLLQQKIDIENENEDQNKQEDLKEIDQDQSEDYDYQPDNDLDKNGISEEEDSFECEQNSFYEE